MGVFFVNRFFQIDNILLAVSKLFETININVKSIDRSVNLIQNNDLSNGRLALWKSAINTIYDNILLGKGISGFELENGTYAHNIVLQILLDYGIIIGSVILLSILILIINLFF